MSLAFRYNLRNLFVRRGAALMTAAGVACVIAVFIVVTSLAEGFRTAVARTGTPENVLILRKGAQSELQSNLDPGLASLLKTLDLFAEAEGGGRAAAADTVRVVNLPRRGTSGEANVTLRGIALDSLPLRQGVRLSEGTLFRPGSTEVIVGKALAGRVEGVTLRGTFRQCGAEWKVVGIFESDGSAFESEIWGDAEAMRSLLNLRVYQSVTARLAPGRTLADVQGALAADRRCESIEAFREDLYYAAQSEAVTVALERFAVAVTVVMSIGAVAGAMNTMYASVANRIREVGTLRAIGFTPGGVFRGFLLESLALCAVGAVGGALLSLLVHGVTTGTTNFKSFSEVAFRFQVTPRVVLKGAVFALVMGVAGGALPAWRASRMRVVEALRRG